MLTPSHFGARDGRSVPVMACSLLAAVVLAGCSSTRQPDPPLGGAGASTVAEGVMPALGELPVLVLPVQRVVVDGALGWAAPGGARSAAQMSDSVISDVLVMRGAGSKWQFADHARRTARRNPTYAADPDALAVGALARLRPGDAIPEPLASEIRGLVALGEARHVLLPVEVRAHRVDTDPDGTGRVSLLIAAIDARLSQLLWIGPVMGDPSQEFTAAAMESAAARLADLILAR